MKQNIVPIVQKFFASYRLRRQPKGHILVLAGNEPEAIFFLQSGEVIQYDISAQGKKTIVNTYRAGSFFPMSWAINKTPNDYFFESSSAIEYRQAPPEDVIALLKANPQITYDLLSRVYRGTDGLLKRTAHLMSGTARNRLLFELAVEMRRSKEVDGDGACAIKLSETELASRTGLTRETVNRQVQVLKAEGLVSVKANVIRINDIELFERVIVI